MGYGGDILGISQAGQQLKLRKAALQSAHDFSQGNLQQEAGQANHEADVNLANSAGSANDRGVFNSSIPQGAANQIQYERGQKLQSIGRRLNYGNTQLTQGLDQANLDKAKATSAAAMDAMQSFMSGGMIGGF